MNLKPDCGLRLKTDGYGSPRTEHFFYGISIPGFDALGLPGEYTVTVNTMYAGEPHCLSLDFGPKTLAKLLDELAQLGAVGIRLACLQVHEGGRVDHDLGARCQPCAGSGSSSRPRDALDAEVADYYLHTAGRHHLLPREQFAVRGRGFEPRSPSPPPLPHGSYEPGLAHFEARHRQRALPTARLGLYPIADACVNMTFGEREAWVRLKV